MGEIAQHVVTFLTSGLLLYFLHENLKTAKEADSGSKANGQKLQEIVSEMEHVKAEFKSLIQSIETNTDRISIYQKNLDSMFDISSSRHGELMQKHEDLMRQQRDVISTVDLERSRLDSFAQAGISLSERVSKNVAQVKKFEDFIVHIKRRLNDEKKTQE